MFTNVFLVMFILLCVIWLQFIHVIEKSLFAAYQYAVQNQNIIRKKEDLELYVKNNFQHCRNTEYVTKSQLKDCVRKDIITTASKISYNSGSDVKNQNIPFRGLRTFTQYVRAYYDHKYAIPGCTGGTTGNTFYYWYTYDELLRFLATYIRCWIPYGWTPLKRTAIFLGHPASGLSAINKLQGIVRNINIVMPMFKNNDIANIQDFIHLLNNNQPYVLETTPNLLFRACQMTYTQNVKLHEPVLISMSADFLFTCQYKFIQSCFPSTKIRMSYGSVEFGHIAVQKDDHDIFTYEIFREYAHVENSKEGTLIVSRLDYKNMPVYNYITDDHGQVSEDHKYIHNLVGKKRYDYLKLDKMINEMNDQHDVQIINVRLNKENTRVQLTTLKQTNILDICKRYFPHHDIQIIICKPNHCITTDNLGSKVLPLIS